MFDPPALAPKSSSLLVVGGGIAGITAALEAAETGYDVFLVEKEPYLGGQVARLARYFPKLCPPYCGLEINLRRLRSTRKVTWLTLAEVEGVSGQPGDYDVHVRLNPGYVRADRCTACGECVSVCPVERPKEFNLGMDTSRAIYLPHELAFPMKYVIDGRACLGAECARCVQACRYNAIDLGMKPETLRLKVGGIVLATGWKPYDATRIPGLGFGAHRNVITNVMMERLAAPNGPTRGRILRPSDGKEARRVAFVQCAGSRDLDHLPYCSAVCCLASIKQATYVRERYPDSQVHIFYIDIRTPGTYEELYQRVSSDQGVAFIKGKVAKIEENPVTKDLVVEAEDMLLGEKVRLPVDMVVLATGMVPVGRELGIPGLEASFDTYGFLTSNGSSRAHAVGVAKRPMDVASSVRDATGAVLKVIHSSARR
ncbi:MAG: CoB--CoM heterodisulfide reductase iron-sulfur subunit A family protein [Chloroflexi bacterium]|nr:CoB--CoM heterodisulfide reductase iron-sulfur subunit A family protein [Chloroflexota bacterium]